MNRSFLPRVFLALSIIASCAISPAGAAEATTGTLVGTIFSNGVPVAAAHVTLRAPSGVYSATSDARGRFSVLGIVPDSYSISVEANGFEPATQSGITVLPSQTQTYFHSSRRAAPNDCQRSVHDQVVHRREHERHVHGEWSTGARDRATGIVVRSFDVYRRHSTRGNRLSTGRGSRPICQRHPARRQGVGHRLRLRFGTGTARLGGRTWREYRRCSAADHRCRINDDDARRLHDARSITRWAVSSTRFPRSARIRAASHSRAALA